MSGMFSATEMCDFNGTANLALKIVSLPEREGASWSSRCCLLPYFLGLERKNLNHPSITKMWTQSQSNHSFQIQISSFLSYLVQIMLSLGLPRWLSSDESSCQCRRHRFDPWVRKIPWRRKWQPTPVFLPGKSRTGGLVGYSPWAHKGLSMTGGWAYTQGLPHSCLEPHCSSYGGRRSKWKAGDFLRERR